MKRWLLLGAMVMGGCAHRVPEPRTPTMVRSFGGKLVPGHYVSPSAYEHYIRGQLFADQSHPEEAADQFRQAIVADGASAYLRTRLSELLLTLGRVDEARDEVEAALHLDPQLADAHLDLGRVQLRLGNLAGAEQSTRRGLALDPRSEAGYLLLVEIEQQQGRADRVRQAWQALARAVPSSVAAHHALARDAEARNDWKTAVAEYRRALELDSDAPDVQRELVDLYRAEGRDQEALALLTSAYRRGGDAQTMEELIRLQRSTGHLEAAREWVERLEEEGGGDERQLWLGWRWIDAGQPERARRLAEGVMARQATADARLLLGHALELLGQPEAAMAQLAQIPPQARQFAAAQAHLARLRLDIGRYGEAVAQLGRAIAQVAGVPGEGLPALEQALATVHEKAGHYRQAVQVLEQALARRPRSPKLILALGAAYERDGQRGRALAVVRKLLERSPDDVGALTFLGSALVQSGQELNEAQRLLERARRLRPLSGEVADTLGWLYLKLGRLDEAEQLLVRAERLVPESPEILQHLGDLYLRRNDRTRAVEAYQRALACKPADAARQTIEQQLLRIEAGKLAAGSR